MFVFHNEVVNVRVGLTTILYDDIVCGGQQERLGSQYCAIVTRSSERLLLTSQYLLSVLLLFT